MSPGGPPPPPETWSQFLERLIRVEGKVDTTVEVVNGLKEDFEDEKKVTRTAFDGVNARLVGVAFTLATSAVGIALVVIFRT